MTPDSLPPVRRIVTGTDASGRSCIIADGESPAVMTVAARPGYRNTNIWRTLGPEASVEAPDTIAQHRGLLPPPRGTVVRVIDIPPEPSSPDALRRQAAATFAGMFADAAHEGGSARHPGMHTTDTVDYAIVLHGELVAILDEDETLMRTGDVLIQRGTRHAWANRSTGVARVCFVLTSASR